ncbi:hypothetical protein FIV42_25310 [Persicimonas caeni]|uniref:DUF4340 domain-containing protein n=1 Tax=Persicimonas caeni TaxID=2292766 RepID=A0A4Y6Q037_PERCE|nr:hypothetical protein [Persicimonas caeni]QDG53941.1 hypothetical protein FIV42_25310 [Persicimonas caeni]QED35162.1 hypothetical protein FRD00_25305 [Persicimonas caeni]
MQRRVVGTGFLLLVAAAAVVLGALFVARSDDESASKAAAAGAQSAAPQDSPGADSGPSERIYDKAVVDEPPGHWVSIGDDAEALPEARRFADAFVETAQCLGHETGWFVCSGELSVEGKPSWLMPALLVGDSHRLYLVPAEPSVSDFATRFSVEDSGFDEAVLAVEYTDSDDRDDVFEASLTCGEQTFELRPFAATDARKLVDEAEIHWPEPPRWFRAWQTEAGELVLLETREVALAGRQMAVWAGEPPRLDGYDVTTMRVLRDGGTRTYYLGDGGKLYLPAAMLARNFDDGEPSAEEMVDEQTTTSGEVLRRKLRWPTFQRPGADAADAAKKLYLAGDAARQQLESLEAPKPLTRKPPFEKPPGACSILVGAAGSR